MQLWEIYRSYCTVKRIYLHFRCQPGCGWLTGSVFREQQRLCLIGCHLWRHNQQSREMQPLVVPPPFPQIDIGAVVIVWRARGKIIRSVLCSIVCNSCTQWTAHTYEQTNSSLDWVLSHWAHFTVLRFIFVHVLFLYLTVYCMHVYCVVL